MTKLTPQQFESIRREYGSTGLLEQDIQSNPLEQFNIWFDEARQTEPHDPTAMVLSTVDEAGIPDSRVVLLKGLDENGFVFYTHYGSAKAIQLSYNPHAALNFYWPHVARQVRVRGLIVKISSRQSDTYFLSRPFLSQIAAMAAVQSQKIPDRAYLERAFQHFLTLYQEQTPSRPEDWGGYCLEPQMIEFWQGRDNRLHDRILYTKIEEHWHIDRMAP